MGLRFKVEGFRVSKGMMRLLVRDSIGAVSRNAHLGAAGTSVHHDYDYDYYHHSCYQYSYIIICIFIVTITIIDSSI